MISAHGVQSCAIDEGRLVCWGQLGDPPVATPDVSDAQALFGGAWGYCGVRESYGLSCWGSGNSGIQYHP